MDVNGTRFKLVSGRADWARATLDGIPLGEVWLRERLPAESASWDATRDELTLTPVPWRFPASPANRSVGQADRRGAGRDRYGNWYWIDDAETGLMVRSSGSETTTPFWPPDRSTATTQVTERPTFGSLHEVRPHLVCRLRGLAVTEDHYLVVGMLEPAGLLVFDLRAGGPPWEMAWPAEVPFAPLDMAPRPGGGVFILDQPATGSGRVWRLDRHLMVDPLGDPDAPVAVAPPAFAALDPGSAADTSAPPDITGAIRAADARLLVGDPVAIDVAGDDVIVVLDRHGGTAASTIRLYDSAMAELAGSPRSLAGFDRRFVAHDLAVVPRREGDPDDVDADLLVTDVQGDQAYRFILSRAPGALSVQPDFYPMRSFGGRGLVGTPDGGWYDFADRWIPLVLQPRPQFVERAVLISEVFDSGIPDCIWHRLLLDGSLSARAGVNISSAASDDRSDLDDPSWNDEPSPYRRGNGSERPFAATPPDARSGTHETLFQAARGRYLRLRLELFGDRQTSPRIRSLRAYYPRFSYLEQYLPAVYREDERSAHFLDGFLANFEGFYTVIEDRIAGHEVLLDPRSAPAEALDWLASWFEVVLDPGWDEARRRLFIRHAVDLFRWRGTERGLRMALGLALLACPDDRLFAADGDAEPGGIRIVERYQTKRASPAMLGDPSDAALPHEAPSGPRWAPADGGAALHARYVAYLTELARREIVDAPIHERAFPVVAPTGDRSPAWRTFAIGALGFVPTASSDDLERWQKFLARRYVRIEALNAAQARFGNAALERWADATLPTTLPSDGARLADWYAFESVVLPGVRAAHRFSVLLPVPIGRATRGGVVRASDARDRMAEQGRVARLVELEKPAHTTFDVKSFWLAFRVGEARLGKDTLLDYGSRSPDLRPPAVLGSMHVGESVLTSAMADLPDRPAVFSGSVDAATRRVARRTDG